MIDAYDGHFRIMGLFVLEFVFGVYTSRKFHMALFLDHCWKRNIISYLDASILYSMQKCLVYLPQRYETPFKKTALHYVFVWHQIVKKLISEN